MNRFIIAVLLLGGAAGTVPVVEDIVRPGALVDIGR
jgi:hypothetical protein